MLIQLAIILLVATSLTVTGLFYYRRRKDKDRLIELNCKFYISDEIDRHLDFYKEQTGVDISGILGNDFMQRNDYIIDYKRLVVRHKTVKMSIKDSMNIIEMPLIVLWQGFRKYIFLLDTGATSSLIHSKCTDRLDCIVCDDETASIYGLGGGGAADGYINTILYYNEGKPKTK